MNDPPSPTLDDVEVVGGDEQVDVVVDVDRWCRLAGAVVRDGGRTGELTLTFVGRDEIAALNAEHLGHTGPTDVLSFPLDDVAGAPGADVPVLLGDVVVCPSVAVEQAAGHAGAIDDELALLVVHGVLHVLGHDHADDDELHTMQSRELELLELHHWMGRAPAAFLAGHRAVAFTSRRDEP